MNYPTVNAVSLIFINKLPWKVKQLAVQLVERRCRALQSSDDPRIEFWQICKSLLQNCAARKENRNSLQILIFSRDCFWLDLFVLCGVESFVKQYFQLFCPSFSLLSLFSLLTKLTILKTNFLNFVVSAAPV